MAFLQRRECLQSSGLTHSRTQQLQNHWDGNLSPQTCLSLSNLWRKKPVKLRHRCSLLVFIRLSHGSCMFTRRTPKCRHFGLHGAGMNSCRVFNDMLAFEISERWIVTASGQWALQPWSMIARHCAKACRSFAAFLNHLIQIAIPDFQTLVTKPSNYRWQMWGCCLPMRWNSQDRSAIMAWISSEFGTRQICKVKTDLGPSSPTNQGP